MPPPIVAAVVATTLAVTAREVKGVEKAVATVLIARWNPRSNPQKAVRAAGQGARTSFWGDVVAGVDRFRPCVMGHYWPYWLQFHPLHALVSPTVHFLVSHFPRFAGFDHCTGPCQRRPLQQ